MTMGTISPAGFMGSAEYTDQRSVGNAQIGDFSTWNVGFGARLSWRGLALGTAARGRRGEGRPTKRTPEVVAAIAQAIAQGLTDREAGLLAGIRHDTITEWRKDPEFSEAIERATAQRLLARLGIGAPVSRAICEARGHEPDRPGKPGRQGSCRKGDCITRGGV